MKTITRSTVLVAALILCACSVSQLSVSLSVLQDALASAPVIIPVLEATGEVPVGIGNIVLAFASAESTAASQASAELLTNDPAAVKSAKIIGYFAAVQLPPGVNSPQAQGIINAIEAAANLFLSQFTSLSAQAAIKSGVADRYAMSSGDRHSIGTMQKKFSATAAKCQALMKK